MNNFSQVNLTDSDQSLDLRSPPGFTKKILIAGAIIAALFLILAVLWAGAEVFLLVFAGLLLSVFFRGLGEFLSKYSPLSEKQAVAAVLILLIALGALGIWLLAPSVENQFDQLTEQLPVVYENMQSRVSQYSFGKRIVEQMPTPRQFILGRKTANVFGRVTGIFSTALDVVTNALIILITAIYFAFNPSLYNEGIIKLVPPNRETRAREVLGTIEVTLRRFLMGISISMCVNGTLTFLGLWILGVPFAIPLGIIAGLLTFIPNIGPFIAAAPAILVALSQSPQQAVYVSALYLGVQNLDGFVMTPLIQQRAVALPPVLVITSQILLAVLFGFLGLLVAVPLFAILFVLVKMLYVEDVLDRKVEVKGEEQVKAEP